jgi:hypothetical protein
MIPKWECRRGGQCNAWVCPAVTLQRIRRWSRVSVWFPFPCLLLSENNTFFFQSVKVQTLLDEEEDLRTARTIWGYLNCTPASWPLRPWECPRVDQCNVWVWVCPAVTLQRIRRWSRVSVWFSFPCLLLSENNTVFSQSVKVQALLDEEEDLRTYMHRLLPPDPTVIAAPWYHTLGITHAGTTPASWHLHPWKCRRGDKYNVWVCPAVTQSYIREITYCFPKSAKVQARLLPPDPTVTAAPWYHTTARTVCSWLRPWECRRGDQCNVWVCPAVTL